MYLESIDKTIDIMALSITDINDLIEEIIYKKYIDNEREDLETTGQYNNRIQWIINGFPTHEKLSKITGNRSSYIKKTASTVNWKNIRKDLELLYNRKEELEKKEKQKEANKLHLEVWEHMENSIKFDLMAGAFTSVNADYVTLFEPTTSMTQKQNKGYIVASIGKAGGEIPYTAYCAKKSYIEKNEDIIQGFTNAIYKGEKWVKEHSSKEIAESISDFFPDTDMDILISSIQSYKDIDAWNETPVLSKEAFEKLQDVIEEAGELEKRADYEKVVNNKYAKEAIK